MRTSEETRSSSKRLLRAGLASFVALGLSVFLIWGTAGCGESSAVAATTSSQIVSTTSTEHAAPAPTTTSTTQATVEIGWAGDTTLGSKYGNPPSGGKALFVNVRDLLMQPDVMIVNLEGTLSVGGTSKSSGKASTKSFSFQAPPSNAAALTWAGIDLVSLANNHSHDYLTSGLAQTKKALTNQGIKYTGMPGQITVVESRGIKIAVLAFAPYGWTANLLNIPAAANLVRKAAAEADIVVVLIHAGAEGSGQTHTPTGAETAFGESRGQTRKFAHTVIDAGADLVLGSGPHVVRGIERYHGHLIAYSLGDFAGWGNFGLAGNLDLSGLITVTLTKGGAFVSGHWYSLRLASPGVPKRDSNGTSLSLIKKLSAQDFPDTFPISSQGVISAG